MNDVSGGVQTRLRESISALIDGEADELELRRVLASADTQEVRTTWRDYHLQRDTLAGVDMRFAHLDITARVHAALADEQLPAVAGGGERWWRPFASVAVAASVAAVVVIGARGLQGGGDAAPVAVNGAVYPAALSQPASAQLGGMTAGAHLTDMTLPPVAQPVALDPDQFARERLQEYLLRHTERAALNNGQGVINFAKVSDLSDDQ